MKKKDFWKIFAVLLVLALALAACGGGEEAAPAEEEAAPAEEEAAPAEEEAAPAEEAEAEAPAGKITIEMWLDPDDTCVQEVAIDTFNAQSDTIMVEAIFIEGFEESTRVAVAAGEGPDVVTSPGPSFVFEMVQAGQLISLDEMSDVYGWGDKFAPFALNLGSVDGQLYSLPDEMETLVLYYNKTLFEENGWQLPTTMDELHALSAEMDAAGVIPFGHGNAEWRPANEWFVGEYLNHVAGPDKVYQALTGEIDWTDPDFVLAIEMLNEAQQNGWYMGGLEFYYTATFDDFRTANATGEAAMNIEGTWAAADINDVYFVEDTGGNEWDWVPVPSLSGDTVFDVGMGNTKSINAISEHPEAAAEFLDHFYSPEVQAARFVTCGFAPAPVKIPEGTITGVDPRIASIFEELSASAAAGDYGYTTWTFWPPKSDVYIYEEIEKVWAGDMTPQEYMEGLNELFQEEFAAGEIPPIPER